MAATPVLSFAMFLFHPVALLLLGSVAQAQFPSLPDDVIVLDSQLTPEVKLSYKQVSTMPMPNDSKNQF